MNILQSLPPGTIMMLGALLIPLLPRKIQGWSTIVLPILSMVHLLVAFSDGFTLNFSFLGNELTPIRVDRLSLIFGYIFHISCLLLPEHISENPPITIKNTFMKLHGCVWYHFVTR